MKLSDFTTSIYVTGAYNPLTPYKVNNLVTYQSKTYICTAASTGNLPTNATYFDLFIDTEDVQVATVGTGTTPASFTLTSDGSTITLNKPS